MNAEGAAGERADESEGTPRRSRGRRRVAAFVALVLALLAGVAVWSSASGAGTREVHDEVWCLRDGRIAAEPGGREIAWSAARVPTRPAGFRGRHDDAAVVPMARSDGRRHWMRLDPAAPGPLQRWMARAGIGALPTPQDYVFGFEHAEADGATWYRFLRADPSVPRPPQDRLDRLARDLRLAVAGSSPDASAVRALFDGVWPDPLGALRFALPEIDRDFTMDEQDRLGEAIGAAFPGPGAPRERETRERIARQSHVMLRLLHGMDDDATVDLVARRVGHPRVGPRTVRGAAPWKDRAQVRTALLLALRSDDFACAGAALDLLLPAEYERAATTLEMRKSDPDGARLWTPPVLWLRVGDAARLPDLRAQFERAADESGAWSRPHCLRDAALLLGDAGLTELLGHAPGAAHADAADDMRRLAAWADDVPRSWRFDTATCLWVRR